VFRVLRSLVDSVQQRTNATKDDVECVTVYSAMDHLCGLVVRVPGYRSRGPGSISGATSFSEKYWVWNGVHSA
jgi:hypothetical protein